LAGLPPASTFAPPATASLTWSSTLAKPRSSISGPTWMPASRPLPTFSPLASSATRFENLSTIERCT
jgi:hypothetical protein